MSTMADSESDGMRDEAGSAAPRYSIRNYRMPAKVFHWTTAVLILLMVASGVSMKQLGDGAAADVLFNLHKTTGVIVLFVVLLRIVYRVSRPEPGERNEIYRRPLLHWVLYGALIAMPLLGWAGISDFGSRGILFGYSLPAIWPEGAGFAELFLDTHGYLAFALLALVALHIGIAMQDHLMRARSAADPKD